MVAGITGHTGKALQDVGNVQVRPSACRAGERVMDVASGLSWLTLRDRHPSARCERDDQVPARRWLHSVVCPASSRGEITARQDDLGVVGAVHRRRPRQDTQVLPGRLARIMRRCDMPGGQGGLYQPRVGISFVELAKLGGGCCLSSGSKR